MLRLILIPVTLVLLTGCQQPKPQTKQTATKPAPKVVAGTPAATNAPVAAPAVTPPVAATPAVPPAATPPATPPIELTGGPTEDKVEYDPVYDTEIKEVFRLANRNEWEEARAKSAGLVQFDPKNATLQRLNTWVVQEGKKRRDQALEDEIRKIDSKNSTYNPTAIDVITENKDHGLPARKDVRDAVDLIESTPWIPKNFGKTIHEQGPLFDFEAAKGPMGKVLEKEVSIHLDNVPFETVDVLADHEIREGIKEYANWPTIPQLYINGEFVGGCDITMEMHRKGELATALKGIAK